MAEPMTERDRLARLLLAAYPFPEHRQPIPEGVVPFPEFYRMADAVLADRERLTLALRDAAILHLADEQTIRNLEHLLKQAQGIIYGLEHGLTR